MNVLFLTISLPNLNVSSNLYGDLMKEFVKNKHTIVAVAPSQENTLLNVENNIKVLRVKTNKLSNVGNIKKGIAYQLFIFQYLYAIRKHLRDEKFDLIIVHSLPPEIAIIVNRLKKWYNCPTYLLHRDHTWQDAVGFGYFGKNSIICRYYKWLEHRLMKESKWIGCMSQKGIDYILSFYPDLNAEKFHILLNYKYINTYNVDKPYLRKKYNLENKFVLIYGGNSSTAQKMENVLFLAKKCEPMERIIFLLIGRGMGFDQLKEKAISMENKNVRFLDFIPKEDYEALVSSCDVGLIVLNEKMATPNFPSKTMSYFNAKIPILAAIDYVTDYGTFLDETKTGLWAHADDHDQLYCKLKTLYASEALRKEFSENGYNFFINNMTPDLAYKTIMEKITAR